MGKTSAFSRLASAPAVMILAAAVTTAVSTDSVAAPEHATLGWAVCPGASGASINARDARALLARRAARNIRELDRVTCAAPNGVSDCTKQAPVPQADRSAEAGAAERLDPHDSTHQHAAP